MVKEKMAVYFEVDSIGETVWYTPNPHLIIQPNNIVTGTNICMYTTQYLISSLPLQLATNKI